MARKPTPEAAAAAQVAPHSARPKCYRCENLSTTAVIINKQKVPICEACAMEDRNAQAKAYCESKGIRSPADVKNWLKNNPLLVKHAPVIEREPGCDDE